ncbi:MAG TPA: phosphate ABC transporter substrate-binding protein [Actinobacteria bacterium]|nr:phosphate ABC transporter substrate-binding protein [Actinomycetota bacterium]HCK78779.1 phosphate ABC transporter substrate-binding protein [Actinomycetota bacterium]
MSSRTRFWCAGLLSAGVVAVVTFMGAPAQAATYVPVSGAGSTWSQVALDQWRRNVVQYGIKINYAGTGSSDGRNQFRNGTVDFGVSEIPYGLKDSGVVDAPPSRGYAYMPIVAGGTSFMYNLVIGGKRVTNLRLSGVNIAKIFTGSIKTWNDKAIAADNPLLRLPSTKIVPVVRSDGSGTTAQFSTYLATKFPSLWNAYCAKAGRSTPCGVTSNYPVVPGAGFVAQSGSLGVSGYVSQSANVGTITYVEYAYALNTGFPVVKVLNRAGYYVEPTAYAVAVGLQGATVNTNSKSPAYLTQQLGGVYDNPDKRTYPLSSYSYMIIPTRQEFGFSSDKGYTLGAFAYYFLCQGQQQADVLGYSPLPINLVKAGLEQVRRIPGVDVQSINIAKCNNPTFSASGKNLLAQLAPAPPACDKQGATQCTTGTGGQRRTSTAVSNGTPSQGGSSAAGGQADATSTTTGTVGTSSGASSGGGTGASLGNEVQATSQLVPPSNGWTTQRSAALIAVVMLLALIVVPPLVARILQAQGSAKANPR